MVLIYLVSLNSNWAEMFYYKFSLTNFHVKEFIYGYVYVWVAGERERA